jgi:predicted lipoprotein with Yx(FWY)xxD motif
MMDRKLVGLFVFMAMLMAACAADGGGAVTTTAAAEPAVTQPPATEPPATEPPAVGATLAVVSAALGEILVDGEGRTLYLFMPDAQGTPTCEGDCAGNWPPLVGQAAAGEGVDAALIGTAQRSDGTSQVTYNGWPLYHFAGDAAAGDTNGQGINDVWFAVSATGEQIGG